MAYLQMDLMGEPEVCDLDAAKVVHQAVPGSQVSVDKLPLAEVNHSCADLLCDGDLVTKETKQHGISK